MIVLVDTSVWVAHFKQKNERLVALLEAHEVLCHPCVVVEVACGTPPRRHDVIKLLGAMPMTPVATPTELLGLIERKGLHARGCGFVDLSLLASTLLAPGSQLWTLDKRLDAVAQECNVAYRAGFDA